jgi:hypothetical protein
MKVTVDKLKDLLREGKVNFEYTKVDGTVRNANGTLKIDFIPDTMRPTDSSTFKANNLRYFDIDKNEWRSVSGSTTEVNVL